ncbi:hypothetical protein [Deinococcus aquatilis]|uniref:hypothetical protein n=1 Tax=Deinococcus aquatilis TaxID=519440 RepID=UPI00039A5FC6|nr:hypothetical protein [Deinococcus aquatilis]
MPLASTPAAGTDSVARSASTKHKAKSQQHFHDRIAQFRAFLDTHTKDGSPLPSRYGIEVAIFPLLVAAGLPTSLNRKFPIFREIAQEYAQKVGLTTAAAFRTQLSVSRPVVLSSINGLTYQTLFDLNAGDLQLRNPKSLASYHSALHRFMVFVGKAYVDQIGHELAGQYQQTLQQFIQKHYDADQNSRSAKSYLNKYWHIVAKRQRTDGLPVTLDAALSHLVKQDGRSERELTESLGMHRGFVTNLMTGRQKSASNKVLTHLEELLKVELGTLTRRSVLLNPRINPEFCPISLFPSAMQGPEKRFKAIRGQVKKFLPDDFPSLPTARQRQLVSDAVDDVTNKRHLSAYGGTLSKVQQIRYTLMPDQMPSRLQQEFDELCEMKRTRGSIAKGKKNKNKIWRAGTEQQWRSTMSAFLGWCLLPADALDPMRKGAGLQKDDLTLGLILLPELITGYIAFRNARADGQDTGTSARFIIQCLSMLSEGHGWVAGHPELLHRMPAASQQTSDTWNMKCAKQVSFITESADELEIVTGRNPFEPIQTLIDLGRPMDLIQEALANNWNELQTKLQHSQLTVRQKSELYRDHVLISMIAALPLRASHWYGMTYRTTARSLTAKDDGELRHVDGQHWGLYLRAKDFKNSRNKSIFGSDADRDLALLFRETPKVFQHLEPLVDEYMRVHRPQLCPGNGPVFPGTDGLALTGNELYTLVRKWTARYLSEYGDYHYGLRIVGLRPFGPHAFRHLMACHILKTTGKFEDAANMLLDSIEMVKQHYGQFMPEDRLLQTFARLDIPPATRTIL